MRRAGEDRGGHAEGRGGYGRTGEDRESRGGQRRAGGGGGQGSTGTIVKP